MTWDVETLHAHFEALLRERDARYTEQFNALQAINEAQQRVLHTTAAAMEHQMKRAEETTERRFETVNTARRVGDDIVRSMMPRAEAVARDASLDEKIAGLTARMDRNDGRSRGLNAGWAYLIAGIGLFATIVTAIYAVSKLTGIATAP